MTSVATRFPSDYPAWRKVFAYAIYPLAFCGSLGVTYALLDRGAVAAVAAGSFVAVVFVVFAERVQPHAVTWTRSRGDVGTDFTHIVISQLALPRLLELALHLPLLALAVYLTEAIGSTLWPFSATTGWSVWLQLYLAVLILDFGGYWWHRLCHEHPLFWRLHATHHSAERLYWLNAGRFHPVDVAASYMLNFPPLVLLGVPAEVIALAAVWVAVHGLFQHSNVELRLGPLNYIFSMAELHRWHHSHHLEDQNKNYGNNVILWDLLFGTFHFPQNRTHDPEDVGFDGIDAFPRGYLGQLASPVTWGSLGLDGSRNS